MQGALGLFMLGQRQVTPGWVNDPVWRHYRRKSREGMGMSGYTPPGGHWVAGRKERSGIKKNRYVTIIDVA